MRKSPHETLPEFEDARVIERPDGFYWQSKRTNQEFGPFRTLSEAITDMEISGDSALEPGETLEEAEDEIGISDWIDPDTGEPAEEGVPRLDDY